MLTLARGVARWWGGSEPIAVTGISCKQQKPAVILPHEFKFTSLSNQESSGVCSAWAAYGLGYAGG